MAIKIPIVTVFDSKGIKSAQYQLNKVQGNFQNLGRNAAIAGAAIAGAFTLLGKAVMDAAESQKVMAQTEAVLKSTGTTANGTAQQIAALSTTLMNQTAVDDELIQSGANLLLTFKNIQNQAGANNNIFDQTLAATLDVARAMGTDASTEAIRLGKALNDPVKGLSALSRVGIQFTKQQKEQIKALAESGDLMGAQKIILKELQSQFGGSGAAYAQTFAGQIDLMRAQLGNFSEDIGMIVMPAVKEFFWSLQNVAPEAGARLKAALEGIDFAALARGLADAVIFLVQNAEAIMKVVGALFVLNTAYNVGRIAIGLYNAGAVLLNAVMGGTATSAGAAAAGVTGVGTASTVAAGKITFLSAAMRLIPWVAVGAAALQLGMDLSTAGARFDAYKKKLDGVTKGANQGNNKMLAFGLTLNDTAGRINPLISLLNTLIKSLLNIPETVTSTINIHTNYTSSGYNTAEARRMTEQAFNRGGLNMSGGKFDGTGGTGGTGSGANKVLSGLKAVQKNLKKQATQATLTKKLINRGLPSGLAGEILGGSKPFVTAREVLKLADKGINKLTKQYNKIQKLQDSLKAGTEEIESPLAALGGGGQTVSAEEEILRRKYENFKAFQESVKEVFGRIKESILDAFKLPELGDSTNAIIRNMNKLLDRTKSFAANISQLSSMGLNAELLQQLIQQGPLAGAKLAAALVAGGAASLAEINAGYNEISSIAGQIATTGATSLASTPQQTNIYNIEVAAGLNSNAEIGRVIVDAIKAYERTSGLIWSPA